MRSLIPSLLVAVVYVAFRRYYTKDKQLKPRLFMEAASFAFFTYVVMWVYRQYWLREGMSTFGKTCPNGYDEIPDPSNSQQTTCVPKGQKTYPVVVGFGQMPEGPK